MADVPISIPLGSLTLTGTTPVLPALTFELREGATVRATRAVHLTDDYTTHSFELTAAEVASITDVTALRFAFIANGRVVTISWAELSAPSSSGAVIAQPGVGTITLTGAAGTTLRAFVTLPGAGSLTLTGELPAARLAFLLGVPAGSVTLAGATPALRETILRITDVGAVTLSGAAPTLLFEYKVTPGAGSLLLTGQEPTGVMPTGYQYGRPSADLADGSWLPSTPAADLYDMLNEVAASDTDYIYSDATPADDTAVLQLTALTTPAAGTTTLRVRAKWTS